MERIYLKNNDKEKILIDGEELSHIEILLYKKKIGIVRKNIETSFHNKVYERMYYEIRKKKIVLKNPKK